jgi:hypothetical protein
MVAALIVTALIDASARGEDGVTDLTTTHEANQRLLHWRQVFFWAGVLLFIFFTSAWVIIRFSKRYRSYLLRERPPPTPSEDVWRMHRLPDDEDPNS